MDFVSADRTRDSEFQAELKNYNFGVAESNKQITRDLDDDRDKEKQAEDDIDDARTFTQIKDGSSGSTALASATATFNNFQKYKGNIEEGVKKAQKVAGETAEKIQQARPTTETPALEESVETGGGALSDGAKAEKLTEAGKTLTAEEKTAGFIGKAGSKALKGLGVVGAVAGMGMAIASDENGGWAKMSTADKLGNMAEIGGAGLDIVGAGLEATGIGVPFGLALQGFGTLLQLGSGVESEISSAEGVDPAKKEAQQEEQEEESKEAKPQQQAVSVSEAQAGGLGVARQQQ
jgi:hypothetical protein